MAAERTDLELLAAARPALASLSAAEIEPIESRTRGWPESWRDIARSLYITLIARDTPLAPDAAVRLAVELMLGVAADLGGTQPYINLGSVLQRGGQAERIVQLLRQHRQDYDRVGQMAGISARHVRRIEARWLQAERLRRQGDLPFEA